MGLVQASGWYVDFTSTSPDGSSAHWSLWIFDQPGADHWPSLFSGCFTIQMVVFHFLPCLSEFVFHFKAFQMILAEPPVFLCSSFNPTVPFSVLNDPFCSEFQREMLNNLHVVFHRINHLTLRKIDSKQIWKIFLNGLIGNRIHCVPSAFALFHVWK